jgi:hypothetical protein
VGLHVDEKETVMLSTGQKTIIGLIGASAPGGVSHGTTDEWLLVIHLAAWRYAGSPVTESELRLEMPVNQTELKDYMTSLAPYQIIEVIVHDDDHPNLKRITAIKHTGVSDPDLTAIADRLQVPIELEHPVFGKLVYDRQFNWYAGRANWGERAIELMLDCENPDQPDRVLETAEVLFREQADWEQRVNEYAAKQLLALKNEVWLEDDEEPLTPAAFINRMTLESISIDEDGGFTFWHGDGDLFWDHAIQINGTLVEGLNFADIPG